MNNEYSCETNLGGARYLYQYGATIAVFSAGMGGDAAFEAVKNQIAKDGGTMYDRDAKTYLVGSVDKLVS